MLCVMMAYNYNYIFLLLDSDSNEHPRPIVILLCSMQNSVLDLHDLHSKII